MVGPQTSDQTAPRLSVGPACLMFFIDETGHESFADERYPSVWIRRLRDHKLCGKRRHKQAMARDEGSTFWRRECTPTCQRTSKPHTCTAQRIGRLFREQQFARLAVTMSKSVVLLAEATPFDITAGALMNRYRDLLMRCSPEPNEVAFLHEASDRLDQLVEKHFGGAVVQINHKHVPVHKGLVAKSNGLPELEVADFIMHAARRRAVHLHRDPTAHAGKDFEVVFRSNLGSSSYIHISECGEDQSQSPNT